MKLRHSVFLEVALLTACLGAAPVRAQQVFSPGLVKCEVYLNIASGAISDLQAFTNYPDNPDQVYYLTSLESPPMRYVPDAANGYANVGERLSGYLTPTESANYVFYMAANTNGQFWLAVDPTQPTTLYNMVTANGDYPAGAYETNQPMSGIPLSAGQQYYFEAYLATDGHNVDLMSIAWTTDTEPPPLWLSPPISGEYLGVYTAADTVSPTAVTNLAVSPSATDFDHLWLAWTAPSDPGNANAAATYDVRYSTQAITSNNWASATPVAAPFVYPCAGGGNQTLEVANLSANSTYYFAMRSTDIAGNVSELSNAAQGQTLASVFSPGLLKLEVWYNVQGLYGYDLRADPKYPNCPDEVHYVPRAEIPPAKYISGNTGGMAEGQRLSGYFLPGVTTNYYFWMSGNYSGELWLSTNADPANVQLVAQGEHDILTRDYDLADASQSIPLVAGRQYYFEALQKSVPEGQRTMSQPEWAGEVEENLAITWTYAGSLAPLDGDPPISGQFLGTFTAVDTTLPNAVTDLAVKPNEFGATHLFLQWSAPADPGNTNAVAGYDLRYSAQPITSNTWASASQVDTTFTFGAVPGTQQTFEVGSLSPMTPYYFAIRSYDAAGNVSQLSNAALGITGSYVNGMDLDWDLEFNVPGADPTANGDWRNREAPLPVGTTWSDLVTNGWLTVGNGWNPILDTLPDNNFNTPFIIQERCRCLSVIDPPDPSGESGANFFVNMDTRDDGYYSQFCFAVALLADGTQELTFNIDNGPLFVAYTNLTTDFHVIRVEVDTTNQQFTTYIDSVNMGVNPYTRSSGGGKGNPGAYATILGWLASAQWDYVQIGTPAPPALQVSRSGNALSVSWSTNAVGFTLQTTTNLSPPNWVSAGSPTVQGGLNVFSPTITGSATRFYRLVQGQ